MDDKTLKPVNASVFAVLLIFHFATGDMALCRTRTISPCSSGNGIKSTVKKASTPTVKHRVKKGETLFSISRRYHVTVDSIKRANRMTGSSLRAGDTLKIPVYSGEKKKKSHGTTPATGPAPAFIWPVKNILSCNRDGSDGVRSIGIVIVSRDGATVRTSAPGVVLKIGRMRGFGTYVVIRHEEKYSTVYSHLDSVNVSQGDKIRKAAPIGRLESNRLHFQIDREGHPVDPLALLPGKR